MYYIIQENLFREYHYNTLVQYLKRHERIFIQGDARRALEKINALEENNQKK